MTSSVGKKDFQKVVPKQSTLRVFCVCEFELMLSFLWVNHWYDRHHWSEVEIIRDWCSGTVMVWWFTSWAKYGASWSFTNTNPVDGRNPAITSDVEYREGREGCGDPRRSASRTTDQLRLVFCPVIYRVLYIPCVAASSSILAPMDGPLFQFSSKRRLIWPTYDQKGVKLKTHRFFWNRGFPHRFCSWFGDIFFKITILKKTTSFKK